MGTAKEEEDKKPETETKSEDKKKEAKTSSDAAGTYDNLMVVACCADGAFPLTFPDSLSRAATTERPSGEATTEEATTTKPDGEAVEGEEEEEEEKCGFCKFMKGGPCKTVFVVRKTIRSLIVVARSRSLAKHMCIAGTPAGRTWGVAADLLRARLPYQCAGDSTAYLDAIRAHLNNHRRRGRSAWTKQGRRRRTLWTLV